MEITPMRKTLTLLFAASSLALGANLALAADRDIGPDEALKLRDAGTIQSFETLNETALKQHPGATVEETELEEENGRYLYQLDLRDAEGQQWDVELDAATGEVLKNRKDD
jgi:uncharacterized membrane protein YkoI